MNKQLAREFRVDFDKAVEQLEKKYGMSIELGTISFSNTEIRAKLNGTIGEKIPTLSANDFKIGDLVSINHKKVEKNASFKVVKINRLKVKVEGRKNEFYSVHPSLLFKKSIVSV
tara:strand:- start:185 stop:529 length:345 start_codon:yes stop_codon:yes gene_type:complete